MYSKVLTCRRACSTTAGFWRTSTGPPSTTARRQRTSSQVHGAGLSTGYCVCPALCSAGQRPPHLPQKADRHYHAVNCPAGLKSGFQAMPHATGFYPFLQQPTLTPSFCSSPSSFPFSCHPQPPSQHPFQTPATQPAPPPLPCWLPTCHGRPAVAQQLAAHRSAAWGQVLRHLLQRGQPLHSQPPHLQGD